MTVFRQHPREVIQAVGVLGVVVLPIVLLALAVQRLVTLRRQAVIGQPAGDFAWDVGWHVLLAEALAATVVVWLLVAAARRRGQRMGAGWSIGSAAMLAAVTAMWLLFVSTNPPAA